MAKRWIPPTYKSKTRKKRPGIHSKTKTSAVKSSKHYKKKYRAQGRI